MSNRDTPMGFLPSYCWSGRIVPKAYELAAANTIIGIGDLLVRTADGVVDRAAATAVQIVGVAAEAKDASSGGSILVWDNPFIVFRAQVDDATVNAQTDFNLNYDIVVADAVNGRSQMEIDGSEQAVTSTLPITLIGLYPDPRNSLGEHVDVLCIINNHVYKSLGTTGI